MNNQDNYQALISLLLPEGILEYFDIVNAVNEKEGLSIRVICSGLIQITQLSCR